MKEILFEEAKKIELDILLDLAEFCEKHGLRYFMAYGTLLGAVRHGGFIPWDDDVDVQMPRQDYNELIRMYNVEKVGSYYRLISPEDPISRHSYIKIIDTRTIKIEKNVDYSAGMLGIDIDIFPIDGQPDDNAEFEKWYGKLQRIYWAYVCHVLKPQRKLKHMGILLIRVLSGSKERLRNKAARLHQMYPYESSAFVGAVESCFNFKGNRVQKSCYESYKLMSFEGHMLKAPVGYDTVLTKMYGDYMKLPPKEKQVTHHSNNVYWKEGLEDGEKI